MSIVAAAVTVSIPQGTLRGRNQKTVSGRPFCSFQGVPYAKPPVGPLRFKPPEPPENWSGIRNATVDGNAPAQIDFLNNSYTGDEDCLYLNIYTPKMPAGPSSSLLPVMVWFYGGGFYLGCGNMDAYGPDYLIEHDVVLVTLNYRLGVLGFLSTEDEVVPGNLGLKDQVAALRWVKNNISYFGGNPDNVTIFGESAGGISCHLLLLSPAAKGLFHRVICQSGVTTTLPIPAPIRERAVRLAKFLGFSGTSSEELVDFLRKQPAQKLIEESQEALSKEEKQRLEPVVFIPTIEKHTTPDSIITEDPRELLKSGKFHRVPIIIGVNSREGLCALPNLLKNKSSIRDLNANIQWMLPFNISLKKEEQMSIARDMKRFYFENQPLEETTLDKYVDLCGDSTFVYPSWVTARTHSSMAGSPYVYFYYFDVVTDLNINKKTFNVEKYSGANHGDELTYLFNGMMTKGIPTSADSLEGKSIARMTLMWTNFAKTGNPTPNPDDPLLSVTWTPFRKDEHCYLHITNDGLNVKKDLLKERMEFCDKKLGQ